MEHTGGPRPGSTDGLSPTGRREGQRMPGLAYVDRSFIPSIQGLRGLAALSVLLVHIQLMSANAGVWPTDLPGWLTLALGTGGRGVELFFIISGFLIPVSLRRHGSVARFLRERVLRIMPLFVVLHMVLYAAGPPLGYKFFAAIGPLDYAISFFANLFFLAPLLGIPLAQQNAWSLTYEWIFYLWVVAYFVTDWSPAFRPWRVALLVGALLTAWCFPSTLYFGLGLAFSVIAPRRWVGTRFGLVLSLIALATMYLCCEYVSVLAGLPAAAVLFAVLLDPRSGPSRLLGLRGFQYLGRVSYSLYLIHPFVLFLLLALAKRLGVGTPWSWTGAALFAVAGCLGSVAAAGLGNVLVERRVRVWLERSWDRATARRSNPARFAADDDRSDRDAGVPAAKT